MKKSPLAFGVFFSLIAIWGLFFLPNSVKASIIYSQDEVSGNYSLVVTPTKVATSSVFQLTPDHKITSVRVVLSTQIATTTASVEVYMSCGSLTGSGPTSFAQKWVFSNFSSFSAGSYYGVSIATSSENRFGNLNDDPRNIGNNQGYWWTPTVEVDCRIDYRTYYVTSLSPPFNSEIFSVGLTGSTGYDRRPTVALYSDVVVFEPVPVYFTEFKSSGFSTSTISTYCDNNFATTSGFIDSIGSSIASGLCRVVVFLIVPPQNAVDSFNGQWENLTDNSFPFSWFADVNEILTDFTASSTGNFPELIIEFGSSTDGIGLENLIVISTSTMSTFMPEQVRQLLLTLLSSGFYLLAIAYIYYDLRNIWGKERT